LKFKSLLLASLITLLLITVIYAYSQSIKIPNKGIIITYNVEIFEDQNCTKILEFIDWGNITINSNYTRIAYLRNPGNVPLLLTMNTSDYNPSEVELVINLTWNLEGSTIYPSEVKKCTFLLTTGQEHYFVKNFTFLIHIYGEIIS